MGNSCDPEGGRMLCPKEYSYSFSGETPPPDPHSPRTPSKIRGQELSGRLIWAIAGVQEVAAQPQEFSVWSMWKSEGGCEISSYEHSPH